MRTIGLVVPACDQTMRQAFKFPAPAGMHMCVQRGGWFVCAAVKKCSGTIFLCLGFQMLSGPEVINSDESCRRTVSCQAL